MTILYAVNQIVSAIHIVFQGLTELILEMSTSLPCVRLNFIGSIRELMSVATVFHGILSNLKSGLALRAVDYN